MAGGYRGVHTEAIWAGPLVNKEREEWEAVRQFRLGARPKPETECWRADLSRVIPGVLTRKAGSWDSLTFTQLWTGQRDSPPVSVGIPVHVQDTCSFSVSPSPDLLPHALFELASQQPRGGTLTQSATHLQACPISRSCQSQQQHEQRIWIQPCLRPEEEAEQARRGA